MAQIHLCLGPATAMCIEKASSSSGTISINYSVVGAFVFTATMLDALINSQLAIAVDRSGGLM